MYQGRRDRMMEVLRDIGLGVTSPVASLYIWARVPPGHSSISFATRLLEEAGVVVTPGVGYGSTGEGYIRLSLTTPDAELQEGLSRLLRWHRHSSLHKHAMT